MTVILLILSVYGHTLTGHAPVITTVMNGHPATCIIEVTGGNVYLDDCYR